MSSSASAPMVRPVIRSIQTGESSSLQSESWRYSAISYLRNGTQGGIIHGCCWRKVRHSKRTVTFGTGGTSHGGEAERIMASHGGISHGTRSRKRWELKQARSRGSLHEGWIRHGRLRFKEKSVRQGGISHDSFPIMAMFLRYHIFTNMFTFCDV